jgi:hypothetical protein
MGESDVDAFVPMPTGPRFKVIVETTSRIGGFGGWLAVYQGLLVLTPTRPTRRFLGLDRLDQSATTVTWIRQPLFPPWLNRAIDFTPDAGESKLRLRLGFAARRRLRPTLVAAGFNVVEARSWTITFGP